MQQVVAEFRAIGAPIEVCVSSDQLRNEHGRDAAAMFVVTPKDIAGELAKIAMTMGDKAPEFLAEALKVSNNGIVPASAQIQFSPDAVNKKPEKIFEDLAHEISHGRQKLDQLADPKLPGMNQHNAVHKKFIDAVRRQSRLF